MRWLKLKRNIASHKSDMVRFLFFVDDCGHRKKNVFSNAHENAKRKTQIEHWSHWRRVISHELVHFQFLVTDEWIRFYHPVSLTPRYQYIYSTFKKLYLFVRREWSWTNNSTNHMLFSIEPFELYVLASWEKERAHSQKQNSLTNCVSELRACVASSRGAYNAETMTVENQFNINIWLVNSRRQNQQHKKKVININQLSKNL